MPGLTGSDPVLHGNMRYAVASAIYESIPLYASHCVGLAHMPKDAAGRVVPCHPLRRLACAGETRINMRGHTVLISKPHRSKGSEYFVTSTSFRTQTYLKLPSRVSTLALACMIDIAENNVDTVSEWLIERFATPSNTADTTPTEALTPPKALDDYYAWRADQYPSWYRVFTSMEDEKFAQGRRSRIHRIKTALVVLSYAAPQCPVNVSGMSDSLVDGIQNIVQKDPTH